MVCEGTLRVAAVMVLVQLGAAQQAYVTTSCSDGGCGTGSAQSFSTDSYGVTTGECAYINAQGQSVKIKFRETPEGQIEAASDQALNQDPATELRACRESAEAVAYNVRQNMLQTQERIFRQQQQLQENLLRQQAIFGQQHFGFRPHFGFPNQFPFQFPYGGFGR